MHKKAYLLALALSGVITSFAQTTFLPLNTENYHVLDRLETRSGKLCDSLSLWDRPEARRNAVNFLETVKAKNSNTAVKPWLSNVDRYNVDQMISESGEWAPKDEETIDSRRAWLKFFYKKQYDFIHIKTHDFLLDNNFFLVVNPVINTVGLYQQNSPTPLSTVKSARVFSGRGAELRGWIGKRVGFYTSITDNQEQYPYFVENWIKKNGKLTAVPGADNYKNVKQGNFDYMQASGYINFDVVKNHLGVTFGRGKHFIGDGISSLFLTDNSANMTFLQLQARIWKLNYECLYVELAPQFNSMTKDTIMSHKYSTIHYLNINTFKWLSIGLFEAEVFARPNYYEWSYLNPIIFTTALNRANGSGDKSILGMSFKAIALKHVQIYGQLLFNEFRYQELISSKKWYGNKYGFQLGAKYFDALTIKNLDLQGEVDAVRPYTYSAQDTLANYTHYNQPLADPIGSGFVKVIGQVKYNPIRNLYLGLRGTFYVQGVDTGGRNYGNNIFNNYTTADHIYGVNWINGPRGTCQLINLNISYQLRRNLFFDLGCTYRKYMVAGNAYPAYSTTGPVAGPLTTNYVYFGLRLNCARRDYDFF